MHVRTYISRSYGAQNKLGMTLALAIDLGELMLPTLWLVLASAYECSYWLCLPALHATGTRLFSDKTLLPGSF